MRRSKKRKEPLWFNGKWGNIKLRSGLEKNVAEQLQNQSSYYDYEGEYIDYVLNKKYLVDFTIISEDQKTFYIEVKGRLTQEDRRKYIAVKNCNPDIDLRFLFGANNKLTKSSKMRYSDWADKNGFKWAVKKLPKEWFR